MCARPSGNTRAPGPLAWVVRDPRRDGSADPPGLGPGAAPRVPPEEQRDAEKQVVRAVELRVVLIRSENPGNYKLRQRLESIRFHFFDLRWTNNFLKDICFLQRCWHMVRIKGDSLSSALPL